MEYTAVFGRTYLWHTLSYTHLEVMSYSLGLWSRECLKNTTLNVSHVLLPCLYGYFAVM